MGHIAHLWNNRYDEISSIESLYMYELSEQCSVIHVDPV